MKAIELVSQIRELKIQVLNLSIPSSNLLDLKKMYEFEFDKIDLTFDSELLRFCTMIQNKSIEIYGGFTLYKEIKETQDFYQFGTIELNKLCMDKETREIFFLDNNEKYFMASISKDEESFLNVIYQIYLIQTQRIQDEKSDPCTDAQLLTEISKEPLSLNFYKTILGCSD